MINHHKPKLSYQRFKSSCYDSNGQFGTHETTNYGGDSVIHPQTIKLFTELPSGSLQNR
uniref:Uncharacterized protein n=1 Tax=Helianthus annuus TaxID=4232 RepID=A0A251VQN5_HELAN